MRGQLGWRDTGKACHDRFRLVQFIDGQQIFETGSQEGRLIGRGREGQRMNAVYRVSRDPHPARRIAQQGPERKRQLLSIRAPERIQPCGFKVALKSR